MQTSGKKACFLFPECRLSYTKIMQTSAMRACSCIAECRLSYTKILQTSAIALPSADYLIQRYCKRAQ